MTQDGTKRAFLFINLVVLFFVGLWLRLEFAPDMSFETDSFVTLLSARSIAETGQYTVPPVRLTDQLGNYQAHPGWAVGYSLLLSLLFSVFQYSEPLARWATILMCCAVIPVVGMAARRVAGEKAGLAAAVLMAVHPLLVCLNGRILTANMGYVFLTFSLSFLLLGAVREREPRSFLTFRELVESPNALFFWCLSFLFFGFTLATRDDFAMFALPFPIIAWQMIRASREGLAGRGLPDVAKAGGMAVVFFLAGVLPNLYYNMKTYGRILTSSHAEFGGKLSLSYFWEGSRGALGLPGWAVMVFTILVFAFPVVCTLLIRKRTSVESSVAAIVLAMAVPIILINGAYPVASSGASPRYVLPLIPFVSILAGIFLVQPGSSWKPIRVLFLAALVTWHGVLFYPPPALFSAFPKTLYLTQYSPWYNGHNYINYPHPIRTTVQWVRANTPPDAIILSDYDSYHYFFYAGRDVMDRERIGGIEEQLRSRPVFFIDDHRSAVQSDILNEWREKLANRSISLVSIDSIPLMSPVAGPIRLSIYALTKPKNT